MVVSVGMAITDGGTVANDIVGGEAITDSRTVFPCGQEKEEGGQPPTFPSRRDWRGYINSFPSQAAWKQAKNAQQEPKQDQGAPKLCVGLISRIQKPTVVALRRYR